MSAAAAARTASLWPPGSGSPARWDERNSFKADLPGGALGLDQGEPRRKCHFLAFASVPGPTGNVRFGSRAALRWATIMRPEEQKLSFAQAIDRLLLRDALELELPQILRSDAA
jgi:hypothetical protein